MNRALTFLGTVVALIIEMALFHWATRHVPAAVIVLVACGIYGVAFSQVPVLVWDKHQTLSKLVSLGTLVMTMVGFVVIGALASSTYIGAFAFALGALTPLGYAAYRKDKREHKTCPDCAERIKTAANVCRYCGHRFRALAA